ncbi:MAG: HepT-like ribonuclease domain-containing protein [Gemmatimonadota bacterium]|nr:HepT-like ribonuclease domain-containing protein [Gemmatimonadota bacterium]
MTFLVERLAELRKHLDHLYAIRGSVGDAQALERDLTLRNDVLFSLMMIAQLVIDAAGEVAAREGLRFEDYTGAVRSLAGVEGFPERLVESLARLPGFRNVLLHEYVELDLGVVLRALGELEPVEDFIECVAAYIERTEADGPA